MRNIRRFLRQYKLMSSLLVIGLAGLGLFLLGYRDLTRWLVSSAAIVALLPIIATTWRDIRAGSYGIDILTAITVVVAVFIGQYWTALLVCILSLGKGVVETFAYASDRRQLEKITKQYPETAVLVKNRKNIEVAAASLKAGSTVVLKSGMRVPVDSLITEGSGEFDESTLTGDVLPVHKSVGEQLFGGSTVKKGSVLALVTASAADSHYQQLIRLTRAATTARSPFLRLSERSSIPFVLVALIVAATFWYISGQSIRFLEIIVVATPFSLLIGAPLALRRGLSSALRHGIFVKSGSSWELLADAQTFLFNKNGTLTTGRLSLHSIDVYNGHTKEEVIKLAASLEQNSRHPIASCIVDYASTKGYRVGKAKHVKVMNGRGLEALLLGKRVVVGRYSLLKDASIAFPAKFKLSDPTKTVAFISSGDELAGVIHFVDSIPSHTRSAFESLKAKGVRTIMLVTGDHKSAATATAKSLDVTEVRADLMPAGKLEAIDSISDRPVVFIGDGLHDASALTSADVGIAFSAVGSQTVDGSADIGVLGNNIGKVADAYHRANRTFKIARLTIVLGIGVSLLLMAIFATGRFTPIEGIVAQAILDVAVVITARRAGSDGQLKS